VCVVAVYPSPLVLQPTYVCSFTSPAATASANNVIPCTPSSMIQRSPMASGLWSPRSTDVVTLVTQRLGLNTGTGGSGLTVPSSRMIPPVNRARTCSDHHQHHRHQLRPRVHPSTASADCSLSTSVRDVAGRLVAGLPADVVKSLLESDSTGSCQTVKMLLDTVTAMKTNVDVLDSDVLWKLVNCPQFGSMVEELASSSRSEAATMTTRQTIGRWRSLPGLHQPTEHEPAAAAAADAAFASRQSAVPSCQTVVRSLGQLGQSPAHQLTDQASSLYWYASC